MTRNTEEFVNQKAVGAQETEGTGRNHVAILLGHYNGDRWLGEQLQSLSEQTHRDWSLIISDDGSDDDWLNTVSSFANSNPERHILLANGPQRGATRNFLSLAALAGPIVPFAAFCDQDDVWLPAKLETALSALKRVRPGRPALYCGRTIICDAALRSTGVSPLFAKPPSFENALVQNIGGGNTMVFNRAALDLLQNTLSHAQNVTAHDWWAYQLISGAGGKVIYDTEPMVLYRQHSRNLIGANSDLNARYTRFRGLLAGRFRAWNEANTLALHRCRHWLTPQAKRALQDFEAARCGRTIERLISLRKSGVFRQTRSGQAALICAATLNKL